MRLRRGREAHIKNIQGHRLSRQTKKEQHTVYIPNKYISPKKTIGNALSSIYGIGPKRASAVCSAIGVAYGGRILKLSQVQLSNATKHISDNYVVGSSLKRHVHADIQGLIEMRSYRGIRHQNHLPVRGQRTHTNAQTRKRWSYQDGNSRFGRVFSQPRKSNVRTRRVCFNKPRAQPVSAQTRSTRAKKTKKGTKFLVNDNIVHMEGD